jgi:hypothetical protein
LQTLNTHSMHSVSCPQTGDVFKNAAMYRNDRHCQCLHIVFGVLCRDVCMCFASPTCMFCGHVLSVAIQGVGCSHHVRCPHALYALLLLYWWIPRKACCEALLSQMLQVNISFQKVVKISTISSFHQRTNRPAPHSPADLQMQVVCSCNSVSG